MESTAVSWLNEIIPKRIRPKILIVGIIFLFLFLVNVLTGTVAIALSILTSSVLLYVTLRPKKWKLWKRLFAFSVFLSAGYLCYLYKQPGNFEEESRIHYDNRHYDASIASIKEAIKACDKLGLKSRRWEYMSLLAEKHILQNDTNSFKEVIAQLQTNVPQRSPASIRVLNARGHYELNYGDKRSARENFETSRQLSYKMGRSDLLISSLRGLGTLDMRESKYASASNYFVTAIQLAIAAGNHHEASNIHAELGELFQRLNDLNRARESFVISYHLAGNDLLNQANALQSIIGIDQSMGYSSNTSSNINLCFSHFSRLGNTLGVANILVERAGLAYRSGDLRHAQQDTEAALNAFKGLSNSQGQFTANRNLGFLALDQRNKTNALFHFEEALRIARSDLQAEETSQALQGLGLIHMSFNEYGEARVYLNQSLETIEHTSDQVQHAKILVTLAELDMAEFRYTSAFSNLEIASRVFSTQGFVAQLWTIDELRAEMYANLERIADTEKLVNSLRIVYKSANNQIGLVKLERIEGMALQKARKIDEALSKFKSAHMKCQLVGLSAMAEDLRLKIKALEAIVTPR